MVKVVKNVSDTKRLQDVPEFIDNIKNQFLYMGEEYGNKKNTEAYSPRILRLELAVWVPRWLMNTLGNQRWFYFHIRGLFTGEGNK